MSLGAAKDGVGDCHDGHLDFGWQVIPVIDQPCQIGVRRGIDYSIVGSVSHIRPTATLTTLAMIWYRGAYGICVESSPGYHHEIRTFFASFPNVRGV